MRKPLSRRESFEFHLTEDSLIYRFGDESAREWGVAFAGWTANYMGLWPSWRDMQARPNFDKCDFSHITYGDIARELMCVLGIGASTASFEEKHGRARLTSGKVFESKELHRQLYTEEEMIEDLVHNGYTSDAEREQFQHALVSSNIYGVNQCLLCLLISENVGSWADIRDIKDDPPSAVEVNEKLRVWMHIADRFDWLAQHGDALPRRPAGR